jgi:hypothetical protein
MANSTTLLPRRKILQSGRLNKKGKVLDKPLGTDVARERLILRMITPSIVSNNRVLKQEVSRRSEMNDNDCILVASWFRSLVATEATVVKLGEIRRQRRTVSRAHRTSQNMNN